MERWEEKEEEKIWKEEEKKKVDFVFLSKLLQTALQKDLHIALLWYPRRSIFAVLLSSFRK